MRLGGGRFVLMYVLAWFSSFDLEFNLIIYGFQVYGLSLFAGVDPGFFNGGRLILTYFYIFGIHACISFFYVLDFYGGLLRRGVASHPIHPP